MAASPTRFLTLPLLGLGAFLAMGAACAQTVPATGAKGQVEAQCASADRKDKASCKARTLGAAGAKSSEPYRPVLIIPAGMAHH